MEKFLSFDEVIFGSPPGIDAMEVFPAIEEAEQIGGANEVAPRNVLQGNPSEASSYGNVPRLSGDVTFKPNSVNVDECVEFLERLLQQHVLGSPCHDKNWTKEMLQKIAKELHVLPNANRSIIENDDEDIMSNWKSYVEKLIKELRVVHSKSLDGYDLGLHVLTNTPYALILEMVAEMVVD